MLESGGKIREKESVLQIGKFPEFVRRLGLRAKKEIIEAQHQLFVLSGFSGNVHIVLMNQISPGNP